MDSKLLSSKYDIDCLWLIRSKTFPTVGITLMGRKLLASSIDPFLNKGRTFVFCHVAANVHVVRLRLHIQSKIGPKAYLALLSMKLVMPSTAHDLLQLNLSIVDITPSSRIALNSNTGGKCCTLQESVTVASSAGICDASFSPISAK